MREAPGVGRNAHDTPPHKEGSHWATGRGRLVACPKKADHGYLGGEIFWFVCREGSQDRSTVPGADDGEQC
jgi:hypothetical protein